MGSDEKQVLSYEPRSIQSPFATLWWLIGSGSYWLTILLWITSAVLLVFAWLGAYQAGYYPKVSFNPDANHGPWRTLYVSRYYLQIAFSLLAIAVPSAILHVIARSTVRSLAIVVGAISILFVVFTTHYWLID